MTSRHMIQGIMKATGSPDYRTLAIKLGLTIATIKSIGDGAQKGMVIATLEHIQRVTKVPFDDIFEWYRLPEDAPLTHIHRLKK